MKKPEPAIGLAQALTKAREIRKTRFESIDGQYWQYLCDLKPGVLDATRREMADATVDIEKFINP